MKSVIDQLKPADRKTLALFYESQVFEALRKLIDLERLSLAKDAIEQTEIGNVRYLNGGAVSLKKLIYTVKEISKQTSKD